MTDEKSEPQPIEWLFDFVKEGPQITTEHFRRYERIAEVREFTTSDQLISHLLSQQPGIKFFFGYRGNVWRLMPRPVGLPEFDWGDPEPMTAELWSRRLMLEDHGS